MTSSFNGGHVADLLFKMKAVISHFLLLGNDELNIHCIFPAFVPGVGEKVF